MADDGNRADHGGERAQSRYAGIVSVANPAPYLDRAINWLAPGAGPTQIARLLGNRVTRQVVQGWRKGRHRPPAWVREVLVARLFDRSREAIATAEYVNGMPVDESPAERARRLTPLRRAKEKARREGGQV